ncbi:MAG: LacI family DNA-binding transcriptional regulator [Trueperaceae bacterium]|nr:LacI family DNA-binding transcriptional regulator [Trueperaceae bacterium]
MPRRRVTSTMVATRAGVSRTTVSFVLNARAGSGIPDETRRRVLRAARDLGYVPSAAATTLASGRTQTIGFVVCDARHLLTDAFLPQAIFMLTQVAHARGFRVLVEAVDDPTAPRAYETLVRATRIDGMVVINPRRDDMQLAALIESRYPVVTIGHPPGGTGYAFDVDNVAATRTITDHLLAAGRRRLAYLGYGAPSYTTVVERLEGYRQALADAGLPFDETHVVYGDYSAESGEAATATLLARLGYAAGATPPFDGLVCGNDTVALGALTALRSLGLRVPDDVAVVGFDDIPIAAHAAPPLTTMRSPLLRLGEGSARLVIDLIEGGTGRPPPARLQAELIVRTSCGSD